MNVIKRSGRKQPLNVNQIRKQSKPACAGLEGCCFETLELDSQIGFTDSIKTTEIQQLLIDTANRKVDVDNPRWTFVAARLKLYDLYHQVKRNFNVAGSGNVYDAVTLQMFYRKHMDRLDTQYITPEAVAIGQELIVADRDRLFTYGGVLTLLSKYLRRDKTELPQHRLMIVAIWLSDGSKEEIKRFYDLLSTSEGYLATPILASGGYRDKSHASCLVGVVGDSTEDGIVKANSEFAVASSYGSGMGWDWSFVRALGSPIDNVKGVSGGVIPHIKVMDTMCFAWTQRAHNRPAGGNVTVPIWHKDILDYIDMRKTSGEELRRVNQLLLTIAFDDVFLQRVMDNEDYTLFDPYDTLRLLDEDDLNQVWGSEFVSSYNRLEMLYKEVPEVFANPPVVVKAKELWKKFILQYFETGSVMPMFIDNANRAHKHPELGKIRSSNLCMEIYQPIQGNTKMAVCNLGSINLGVVKGTTHLRDVTHTMLTMLNRVIDKTTLHIESAKEWQAELRAIGLGVFNEQAMLVDNGIRYGDAKHSRFIEGIYNHIRQVADTFTDNKYKLAIAPTSSISTLVGGVPSIEPIFAKRFVEDNNVEGSPVMCPPTMTVDNYHLWATAYEVPPEVAIELTAIRQKYIDQGISHNIHVVPEETTGKTIHDMLILAWKLGLKSTYYMRSRGADVKSVECGACG